MNRTAAFPADPRSVAAARRFVTEALLDAPVEVLAVIQMMVSELATNAVQHVRASFDLTIRSSTRQIRVEVTDKGGGTPAMQAAKPEDLRGRGLRIVDMLSTRWGVERHGDAAKTVWFTVAVRPQEAGQASPAPAGPAGR